MRERRKTLLNIKTLSTLISLTLYIGCGSQPAHQSHVTDTVAQQDTYPTTGRYTAIYMLKQYEGESDPLIDMSIHGDKKDYGDDAHEEPVLYWNDAKRKIHLIQVKNGLLVDHKGEVLDPKLDLPEHKNRGGEAIYIMDVSGNIYYCFDAKYGRIHHSTLAAGQPVAAAGELVIINGELISISNESGHYRPPVSTIDLVIGRFKELGVKTEGVKRFELLPKKDAPPPERLEPDQED